MELKDIFCGVCFCLFVLFLVLYLTKKCKCKCPEPLLFSQAVKQLLETPGVSTHIQTKATNLETAMKELEVAIGGDTYSLYADLQSLPPSLVSQQYSEDAGDCLIDCIADAEEICLGSVVVGPEVAAFCFMVGDIGLSAACNLIFC